MKQSVADPIYRDIQPIVHFHVFHMNSFLFSDSIFNEYLSFVQYRIRMYTINRIHSGGDYD